MPYVHRLIHYYYRGARLTQLKQSPELTRFLSTVFSQIVSCQTQITTPSGSLPRSVQRVVNSPPSSRTQSLLNSTIRKGMDDNEAEGAAAIPPKEKGGALPKQISNPTATSDTNSTYFQQYEPLYAQTRISSNDNPNDFYDNLEKNN